MSGLDLGPHAAFIVAAYGAVALVLAGLVTWLLADDRKQRRVLAELEASGVTRRSARKARDADDAAPEEG
ncbi:MAG: heme exporter protein CcmD [Methyloligellaceae bacterium]